MPYYGSGHVSLESFAVEIVKVARSTGSEKEWAEWLRVPLRGAARNGNIDLVNALIEAGANVGAGSTDRNDHFLLKSAVFGGNVEVVSALIAAGSPLEVPRESALNLATFLGHQEAARRLVKAGADLHYRNFQDWGILFSAVERGREELVNDLLAAGASPNTANGKKLRTPLHVAAKYGSKTMVSALLARGADKDARDIYGKTPLMDAAEKCGKIARFFENEGIHMSAEPDHLGVVNSLLTAGADVDTRDRYDSTALITAAIHGRTGVLNAILRHGADMGAVNKLHGSTALHIAVEHDQAGAIHALVEAGADTELQNSDGLTPLGRATQYNACEAMRALVQRGANTDLILHVACYEQYYGLDTTVDTLLRSGADETAVDGNGRTPLELLDSPPPDAGYECSTDQLERAQLLLARAPQDRIWRRRWPLLILRSRASKAKMVSGEKAGGSEHCTDAAGGREDGGRSKMTRVGHASGGESGLLGQVGDGFAVGAGSEGERLRAVVETLFRLEVEDVFRTVVRFL